MFLWASIVTAVVGVVGAIWAIVATLRSQTLAREMNRTSREAVDVSQLAELRQWTTRKLDELSSENGRLQQRVDQLVQENAHLRDQVIAMQATITGLLAQQQQSLNTASQAERERTEAQAKVEQLEAEVDNLHADITRLTQENATLRDEVAALRKLLPDAPTNT